MNTVRPGARSAFLLGLLGGIALTFGFRLLVNTTPVADRLVAPLLTADAIEAADAIVVPGAGAIAGCVPNDTGVRRVLLAARLWRDGQAPILLFTGGLGDGGCAVSVAMAAMARDVGVPGDRVLVESSSQNTRENGALSAPLLRGLGVRRVLVVTDRLHMRRALAVFSRHGFDALPAAVPIYEGHDDNTSVLYWGLREYAALAYYRIRGWIGEDGMKSGHEAAGERGVDAPAFHTRSGVTSANPNGPIVVLGASYARGWPLTHVGQIDVVNLGISGEQSFEMLARFESEVLPARPKAVIIWGFINDIFRTTGEMASTLVRMQTSVERMVTLAKSNGIEPILATEVTIRPPRSLFESGLGIVGSLLGRESYQDRINGHVRQGNDWLTSFGREQRLLVLDFSAVVSDERGQRRRRFADPDGSHITPAGYAALTAYAVPLLERWLAR